MKQPGQSTGIIVLCAVALLMLLALYSMNYVYFVALALLPSAAAAVIEPAGQRPATISITSMTAATVLPLVLNGITNHRPDLLMRVSAWGFVGCAVLGGVVIFLVLPA